MLSLTRCLLVSVGLFVYVILKKKKEKIPKPSPLRSREFIPVTVFELARVKNHIRPHVGRLSQQQQAPLTDYISMPAVLGDRAPALHSSALFFRITHFPTHQRMAKLSWPGWLIKYLDGAN